VGKNIICTPICVVGTQYSNYSHLSFTVRDSHNAYKCVHYLSLYHFRECITNLLGVLRLLFQVLVFLEFSITSEVHLQCGNLACSAKYGGQSTVYFRKSKSKFKFARPFKQNQTWCCSFCPGSWLSTLFLCLCYTRVCYEYDSTKVCFWILSPSFHRKHWFVWTNFTIDLEWIISSLRLLLSFGTQLF